MSQADARREQGVNLTMRDLFEISKQTGEPVSCNIHIVPKVESRMIGFSFWYAAYKMRWETLQLMNSRHFAMELLALQGDLEFAEQLAHPVEPKLDLEL